MAGKGQVAAGAASNLQQGTTRRHLQAGDHFVAAKQVILACEVVDMPLVPIHAVHVERMVPRVICSHGDRAVRHAARFS